MRIARYGDRIPLAAHWGLAAWIWRVGSHKRRIGEHIGPLLCQADQVVAVGTIAVEENHQLPGFTRRRRRPWPVQPHCHCHRRNK